ncbi:hypothetical protein PTKIN_Ptkin01aG0269500 [Pterospermum kingtungense]
MASPNQQERPKADVRCSDTTTPNSAANLVLENCLNINQSATNDNEKCLKGEAKKRSFEEMITDEDDEKKKRNSLDLNLRLTPLGLHQKDHYSSTNQINSSEISSTSSCMMPLNLDSSSSTTEEVEFISNTTSDQVQMDPSPTVSLILMGCKRCLIYVMVSEADPKCPKCHNPKLLDIFRNNSGKKSRNSY